MRKAYRPVLIVILLAAFALAGTWSAQHAESASVDPSWELLEGEPDSCSLSSSFGISVEILASAPASEQGTFTVPGYGQVGHTTDTSFTGSGTFGFTVFIDTPYTVAANTPVTLTVTTYNGPNFTGGASFVSSLTWDCTTGAILDRANGVPSGSQGSSAPVPGCDVTMSIPATAVGGTFVADAPIYAQPGVITSPVVTIPSGNSARVLGLDASGQYYQIIWACSRVWVPANTLGPNFDAVWQGRPLPTGVVE